jgi:hypothetical protein
MILKAYLKIPLPTPQIYKNKYVGGSALVIGTGLSTTSLIKYKDRIKSKFDVIIGLNFSTKDFEDEMTHHLVLEKNPVQTYTQMKENKFRRDLPRILNFKSLHRFPKNANIIKATRSFFSGKPNIREYHWRDEEGFMNGPPDKQGLSLGSVGLHGLHLAGIMGCSHIYLIGIDFIFGKRDDHYYKDRYYRDNAKEEHKSPLTKVEHNGKIYQTTNYFRDSAKLVDKVIETMCRPNGIEVFSFSDGLVASARKLDLDEFFAEG